MVILGVCILRYILRWSSFLVLFADRKFVQYINFRKKRFTQNFCLCFHNPQLLIFQRVFQSPIRFMWLFFEHLERVCLHHIETRPATTALHVQGVRHTLRLSTATHASNLQDLFAERLLENHELFFHGLIVHLTIQPVNTWNCLRSKPNTCTFKTKPLSMTNVNDIFVKKYPLPDPWGFFPKAGVPFLWSRPSLPLFCLVYYYYYFCCCCFCVCCFVFFWVGLGGCCLCVKYVFVVVWFLGVWYNFFVLEGVFYGYCCFEWL